MQLCYGCSPTPSASTFFPSTTSGLRPLLSSSDSHFFSSSRQFVRGTGRCRKGRSVLVGLRFWLGLSRARVYIRVSCVHWTEGY